MCSPISPVLTDYRDALLAAVAEVAENSLFAFADASDEATFEAAATAPSAGCDDGWLLASLDFKGSIAGRFGLVLPVALARHLCASFAGAETSDEIGEENLIDFTGELTNMVCGAWLTRVYRHEAFSLMPPYVCHGQPDVGGAGDAGSERFYLSIDEAPIRLAIHWATANAFKEERDHG